ncbi:MAG TPA: helix-turn-helix transcriptional regulator [Chloroflexota bacterium]|nr:helix-turn-helix transcriptional regulator [Chloroflexota bacterium]
MALPHWDRRGYQRIARVAWQAPDLVVDFEDGTRARLEADRLLLPDDGPVEWDRLTWSPYEIAVPGPYEVVIVPWSRIRVLTDTGYAAHLAAAADAEARQIGRRIRELRQARGLTGEELAARAGISTHHLARLERGERDSGLPPIEPLLAAMGCTLQDLIPPDTTAQPRERAASG